MDDLPKEQQKLVADLVPAQISMSGAQRVLQNLLGRAYFDPRPADHPRRRRRGQRLHEQHHADYRARPRPLGAADQLGQYLGRGLRAHGHALADVGAELRRIDRGSGRRAPTYRWRRRGLQEFIQALRQSYERFAQEGETPILLTSPAIRPYVRSIVERFRPQTVVSVAKRDPSEGQR